MKEPNKESKQEREVREYNEQLLRYRKTGIPYLSEEDLNMDFSHVDNPDYDQTKKNHDKQ